MDYYEKKRKNAKKAARYAGERSIAGPFTVGVIAAVACWVCVSGIVGDKEFAAKLGAAVFGAFAVLAAVSFLLKRARLEKMKAALGASSDEELEAALEKGYKLADTVYAVDDKLLNFATRRAYFFDDIEELRPYSKDIPVMRSSRNVCFLKIYFIKAKLRNGSSDRLPFRTSEILRDAAVNYISERLTTAADPDYTSIID